MEAEGCLASLSCLATLPWFLGSNWALSLVPPGGASLGPGFRGSTIWSVWVSPPAALDLSSQGAGNCCGEGLEDLAHDHRGLRTTWPSRGPAHVALPRCSIPAATSVFFNWTSPCHSSLLFGQEPRKATLPRIREVLAELPCFLVLVSSLNWNMHSAFWSFLLKSSFLRMARGSCRSLLACLVSGLGPPALGAAAPARAVPASSRPGVRVPVRGPGLRSTFAPASGLSARPRAAPLVPLLQLPHPRPWAPLPRP